MFTLGLTLTDGESVKAGNKDFNHSHIFDSAKKITKVEVNIWNNESLSLQMNSYNHG